MSYGESIKTAGDTAISYIGSINRQHEEDVYDLEIFETHCYFVSDSIHKSSILAHNNDCSSFWNKVLKYGNKPQLPFDHVLEGHSWANRLLPGNASKTVFSSLINKTELEKMANLILKDKDDIWVKKNDYEIEAIVDVKKYSQYSNKIIGYLSNRTTPTSKVKIVIKREVPAGAKPDEFEITLKTMYPVP